MAKRKQKQKEDGGRNWTIPLLVDRLPLPPPFTKDEWEKLHLRDIAQNPVCADYLERSIRAVMSSPRAPIYLDVLAMAGHIGRLPEFTEESFGQFLEEAHQQRFSESQLARMLELILQSSGPKQVLPTAAAAFEFLAFTVEIVQTCVDQAGTGAGLIEMLEKVRVMVLLAFGSAVNVELGIRNDVWKQ